MDFKFSWIASKPMRATRAVTDTDDSELFSGPHMNHIIMYLCIFIHKT